VLHCFNSSSNATLIRDIADHFQDGWSLCLWHQQEQMAFRFSQLRGISCRERNVSAHQQELLG
jgi:hypothetical protein